MNRTTRKRLSPYLLLIPGLAWLACLFLVPLGFLGYQSLQSGSFERGYDFSWHFSNYSDAFSNYHEQLLRSFLYAGIATILALLIAYPLVYWIAFRAGRWKNFFLLAIVAPLFVTYLVRTLAWLNILADEGPLVRSLDALHLLGSDGRVLATSVAVVAGITYNFLPFMALPIYVSLEQVDQRLIESAKDLVRRAGAGVLQGDPPALGAGDHRRDAPHVHPGRGRLHQRAASGDAEPGDDRKRHPVEVPRAHRLPVGRGALVRPHGDDPDRAARLRQGRRDGKADRLMRADAPAALAPPVQRKQGFVAWVRRNALTGYAILAFGYLMLPIAVVILFSFNAPSGRFNYIWEGFTLDNWIHWDAVPGIRDAVIKSLEIGALSTIVATVFGTMVALAIVRHRFFGRGATNLFIFLPMATPEIVLGASLLTLFLNVNVFTPGFITIFIAHVMFVISYIVVTVKARLIDFDVHLEEAAMDLGATEFVTFRKVTLPLLAPPSSARRCSASRSRSTTSSSPTSTPGGTQTFPLFVWGAARVSVPPQVNVIASAIFIAGLAIMAINIVVQRSRTKGPA